jgi:hypothetical protein
MIPNDLQSGQTKDPSRSWEIQRGHRDRKDLRAKSGYPLQLSVTGDAGVTGVRVASWHSHRLRAARASAAI